MLMQVTFRVQLFSKCKWLWKHVSGCNGVSHNCHFTRLYFFQLWLLFVISCYISHNVNWLPLIRVHDDSFRHWKFLCQPVGEACEGFVGRVLTHPACACLWCDTQRCCSSCFITIPHS